MKHNARDPFLQFPRHELELSRLLYLERSDNDRGKKAGELVRFFITMKQEVPIASYSAELHSQGNIRFANSHNTRFA